jgi:autophagy-related protein 101
LLPKMNARSQVFEIAVEARQVEEAVASIFHTVLFHRSFGKFTYQDDSSYIIGTIGYEDVDCDYIGGYTYVKGQSPGLDRALRQELAAFSNDLRRNSGTDRGAGQVSLEFYQKKKRWIGQEDIPWEVWTVRCELVHLVNEQERLRLQEKVGEMLSDKVMYISEVMNKHDYVPKMPSHADLELIFDTSYPDVQPYLFKISHATSMPTSPSMGTAVRRLIRDTLTFS